MKISVLTVGKCADRVIGALCSDYFGRACRMAPVVVRELGDVRLGRNAPREVQKVAEGRAILAAIGPSDLVILLDERGDTPTSRGFAADLDRLMCTVAGNIVFVIGGPYGFSDEVYARANRQLALSAMTLTHEMARMLFAEQLYRALTIVRGLPYHHD